MDTKTLGRWLKIDMAICLATPFIAMVFLTSSFNILLASILLLTMCVTGIIGMIIAYMMTVIEYFNEDTPGKEDRFSRFIFISIDILCIVFIILSLMLAYKYPFEPDILIILNFCFFQWMAILMIFLLISILPIKGLQKKIKNNLHIVVGLMVILFIGTVLQYFVMLAYAEPADSDPNVNSGSDELETVEQLISWEGYLNEGQETVEVIDISGIATENRIRSVDMNLTLTWIDEADASVRHVNQPDGFQLMVTDQTGITWVESPVIYNDPSSKAGEILLEARIDELREGALPVLEVHVQCVAAGDHEAERFGLLRFSDDGNDWALQCDMYCAVENA